MTRGVGITRQRVSTVVLALVTVMSLVAWVPVGAALTISDPPSPTATNE
ncbi:hypothetical protein [Haloferax volcanii]|jgi:hypothetical protein|nr:hypothetical protein [Haloferax lucentense]